MKLHRELILLLAFFCFFLSTMGTDFNTRATINNDCRMPVYNHSVENNNTHFTFIDKSEVRQFAFTDRFRIGEYVYSIGDFIIYIFGALFYLFLAVYVGLLIKSLFRRKNVKYNYKGGICEE